MPLYVLALLITVFVLLMQQWSSRLKQALEASPARTENAPKQPMEVFPKSAAKGNEQLFPSSSRSILPQAGPTISPSHNLVCSSSSNLPETDLIVSPSPLVSWRTGSCMVESGKQLFLLTPLPKTKACSSRCPRSSKTQLKESTSMDELNLPNLPVWKLTISDDNRPDLEQSVKAKEARARAATPNLTEAKKGSLEDSLFSPFSFSIQKCRRALPSPCLTTALRGKKHVFSPISEGSSKDGILSAGPAESERPSAASDDMLSDEKDLAARYPDMYGFNLPAGDIRPRREADEALDWFLSPLKTCVLMDPSPTDDKPIPNPIPVKDNKSLIGTPWKGLESNKLKGIQELSDDNNPIQTPAVHSKALLGTTRKGLEDNLKWGQELPDDKPIQTPALHSKALLGTPWKDLESTNLKGRHAGETTLKKELWTRFEAVSTDGLHFDKSVFQKSDGRRFIDMLEDAS